MKPQHIFEAEIVEQERIIALQAKVKAEVRAEQRRTLYHNDELYRLGKLKANRETRLRAKVRDAR